MSDKKNDMIIINIKRQAIIAPPYLRKAYCHMCVGPCVVRNIPKSPEISNTRSVQVQNPQCKDKPVRVWPCANTVFNPFKRPIKCPKSGTFEIGSSSVVIWRFSWRKFILSIFYTHTFMPKDRHMSVPSPSCHTQRRLAHHGCLWTRVCGRGERARIHPSVFSVRSDCKISSGLVPNWSFHRGFQHDVQKQRRRLLNGYKGDAKMSIGPWHLKENTEQIHRLKSPH